MRYLAILLLIATSLAGCSQSDPAGGETTTSTTAAGKLQLVEVASDLDAPVFVTQAGDDRLFVVEQPGRVLVLADGSLQQEPFLDIQGRVGSTGSEQGLLGLAFPPAFASEGWFVVDYTDLTGDTVVSRFHMDGGAADPASEQVLLSVEQPFVNHNGGMVAFGPDGMLYIGMGDGGAAQDPAGHAQNAFTLLGAMLRIEVDGSGTYTAPSDNPYVGGPQRDEIWATGLRNPWRFSFDRDTGDLWIADVGQDAVEEVNLQDADSPGGENYGWNRYEGSRDNVPGLPGDFTFPVAEYENGDGRCSVTGGYLYRGAALPELHGAYLFGDYCSGDIWRLDQGGDGWEMQILLESDLRISSFGEDGAGELYVVDHGGAIHRFQMA